MTKFENLMVALTMLAMVGLVIITIFDKETVVIVPIITALVGWLIGKKNEAILGVFTRKKKEEKLMTRPGPDAK